MKQWAAFLLAAVLFAGFAGMPVWAAEEPSPSPAPGVVPPNGILGQRVAEVQEKPGILERALADLFISVSNWLFAVFDMKDIVILTFERNPMVGSPDGFGQGDCAGKFDCRQGTVLGGALPDAMANAVDVFYRALERFVPFPLFFALLVIGLMVLWQAFGASAERRSSLKDYMTAYVLGLLAFRYGFYLMNFVAWIVQTFTDLIWYALQDAGIRATLFMNTIWGDGEAGYRSFSLTRTLVVGLISLAAVFMTFTLNYQYVIRSIMIAILVILFPVVCVLVVFPRYRHSLQTWVEEFVSNMILPAAHALALGLFFLLIDTSASVWILIAYFFALPRVVGFVRKLVGVEDSHGGAWKGIAAAAGLAGFFSVAKMLKPKTLGSPKAVGESVGGSGISTSATSGISASGGSEAASAKPTGAAAPAVAQGSVWRTVGRSVGRTALRTTGRVAGYGLRVAGAVTGFAVGTFMDNPAIGAAAGGAIGHRLAQGVERVVERPPGFRRKRTVTGPVVGSAERRDDADERLLRPDAGFQGFRQRQGAGQERHGNRDYWV